MEPTSGPWRTEAVSDAVRVIVGEGRKKVILARLCPPQIPETETQANATLMAAAPELLVALETLVEKIEARFHEQIKYEPVAVGQYLIAARVAIGKAKVTT